VSVANAAAEAERIVAAKGRTIPHGLGHGVGLDIHEAPRVRRTAPLDQVFLSGMVVTLEPGLYDPAIGGCRWENDVLITGGEPEVLSGSRIVRL
jgi:Xaa-Pro dipeptidase